MEEPGAGTRGREGRAADAPRLRGAEDALPAATAPEPATAAEVRGAAEARLSTEVHRDEGGDFSVGLVPPAEAVSASTEGRRFQIGQGKASSLEQRVMDMEEEEGGSLAPALQSSAEPVGLRTCHEANDGFYNKSLCAPCGEAVCPKDMGCVDDTLEETADGSQFDREVGNRGDCGGKATVEDLRIAWDEAQRSHEDLLGPVSHGSEQEPRAHDDKGFITDANDELQQDALMPDIEAEVSRPAHEDLVPSISGGIDLSLNGKMGQFGGISGNSMTCYVSDGGVQNDGLCAAGGKVSQFIDASMYDTVDVSTECGPCQQGILSGGRGVLSGVVEDSKTCYNEPQSGHEGLPDLVNHDIERLPCSIGSTCLKKNANHDLEKDGLSPKIGAESSWTLQEDSVPLDGQVGKAVDTSENSAGFENLGCHSMGEDMMSYHSGLQTEAYGDENQHSGLCADKELQRTSLKYGTSEQSPEENLCVSSYNQPRDDELCSGKESSALCPGHQDSAVGRSGNLDQGLNACNCADDSSVDFASNANDGGSPNQKLEALNVFSRRRNPKRAASSRKDSERPGQTNQASSSTRKTKKGDVASSLHQTTMSLFPNKIAKGRSGMNRPPKPSTWGSLKELLGVFCQTDRPSASISHPTCLDKGVSDNKSFQKSQPSIRKSRSSRSSKSKCSFSVTGHTASELNGQLAFSPLATDFSLESHRENIPKLSSDTSITIFDSTRNAAESTASYRTVKSKCTQTEAQQLERVLVNSTKETCAADVHGECAKLSTSEPSLTNANGSVMLHVGFSPDSVLEVASVTSEGNGSASHDVMLHENSTDTSALNVGVYHPSLSTSNFGKEQALLSLVDLEQQDKTALLEDTRKDDDTRKEDTVDNDVGEGKTQALPRSNAVRKINIVRKAGCKKKDGFKGKRKNVIGSTKIFPCEASKLRPFSSDSISPDPSEAILCTGPPEFSPFETLSFGTQDRAIYEQDSILSHSVMDDIGCMKSPRRKKKDANAGNKGKVRDPHKGKSKKKNITDDTSFDHRDLTFPSCDMQATHMNEQSTSLFLCDKNLFFHNR